MKFRIRYRRIRVTVEGVKPCYCMGCGAIGRIELHHWHYAYKTSEVRKNPQLALDCTIGFCFICHIIADAIRKLMKDQLRFRCVIIALSYAAIQRKKEELHV